MTDSKLLLSFRDVHKTFGEGDKAVQAVRGVSLSLGPGESLGLVGESGCGKSTTARLAVGLESPTQGDVSFDGQRVERSDRAGMMKRGGRVQFIFQDPYSSLNPRMRVGEIVGEPLAIRGVKSEERHKRVVASLADVGMDASVLSKYPHQFSGGQRQRIAIARALSVRPELLVLDEPTSGLDVSIQGQILELLAEIRSEYGVAFLFISHDLAVVRAICDRVAIMYLGQVVEHGSSDEIFNRPTHPYSQALVAASLDPDPAYERGRRRVLAGSELPSPYAPPSGCTFHPRCHVAAALARGETSLPRACTEDPPELVVFRGNEVACHFAEEALEEAGSLTSRSGS